MITPKYPKIETVFKREHGTKKLLYGEWTTPEFEYLQHNPWDFTEKVDGTNVRISISETGSFKILGKNDESRMPLYLVDEINQMMENRIEKILENFPEGASFYGEGIGGRIQKVGPLYGDVDFVLFDVRIGHWWLKQADVDAIAKELDIKSAPVIGSGTLHDMVNIVQTGVQSQWGDFMSEGIVARTKVGLIDRAGHRIITKIKHRDFE